MSKVVNVHTAKTHLSRLLEEAALGEDIVIARGGVPVARLVPIRARTTPRAPGGARGKLSIGPDFDAPLPPDIAQEFGC